ncbi:hypothetical protein HK104_011062 [Borealophlyctis nickersoniae]|nr:hypothetical protein HK104_011062 [Borealophlyctis nickersoniae]
MHPLQSFTLAFTFLAILISGTICYFQIKACVPVNGKRSRLLYLLAGCAVCVCGSLVLTLPYALVDVNISLAETATERFAVSTFVIGMMFTYAAGYTYGLILLDRFALFHHLLHYLRYLIPFLFGALSIIYPVGFLSNIIVIWRPDLTVMFNVMSFSACLYVILLDVVMAPVMVRKVFAIMRELERGIIMDVTGRDKQQESAGLGGEKVTLSVDVGWQFVTLFVGAMVFDVSVVALYGCLITLPDDVMAIGQLISTTMTGLLFLKTQNDHSAKNPLGETIDQTHITVVK